jgi:hypothetical protein
VTNARRVTDSLPRWTLAGCNPLPRSLRSHIERDASGEAQVSQWLGNPRRVQVVAAPSLPSSNTGDSDNRIANTVDAREGVAANSATCCSTTGPRETAPYHSTTTASTRKSIGDEVTVHGSATTRRCTMTAVTSYLSLRSQPSTSLYVRRRSA